MADYTANAKILSREDLNDELAIFRVAPDSGAVPSFVPGQYAELAIPDLNPETRIERRSYSIASGAVNPSNLEFYVVLVPGGYLTDRLWKMPAGTPLWLGPKIKGKFTLDEIPKAQNLIMVSTGTGLAPFVSMLRTYGENPSWKSVTLIHGARYVRDLGYREELEALDRNVSWFHYLPSVTREQDASWKGLRGRVQQLFETGEVERAMGCEISKEHTHILLCGNPQMIDDVEALLGQRGLKIHKKKDPGNIHVERYW